MQKRQVLSCFLAAALAGAAGLLSGCGDKPASSNGGAPAAASSAAAGSASSGGDLLARIKAKGEVTIAMEGTWSPWTYHDEKGELVGYDVEVGRKIAEKLGVKPVFIEGKWDGLLAGISAGRYDMMINGVGVTKERAAAYDFSDPYAFDRTAVIVKSENDSIKTMADLKGQHTANTISSTYATVAEANGATVTGVDDLNQTFELLLSGRIDATLNAEVTYYDYMKAHPDAKVKIACLAETASPIAMPFKKGDDSRSLREAVNAAVKALREEGELSRLSKKYFGIDISQERK